MGDTWDVVTTVKASSEKIELFCRYYLLLGAGQVFIFLDDPEANFEFDDPRVRVTGGARIDRAAQTMISIEERQRANATLAAQQSRSEWLLHCDIDEYLEMQGPVAKGLAMLGDAFSIAVVLPIEPVYLHPPEDFTAIMGAEYFKMPHRPRAASEFWQDFYGDLAELSDKGYWAHVHGKTFNRTRLVKQFGETLQIHSFYGKKAKTYGKTKLEGAYLRHFDVLEFDSWLSKHRDRARKNVIATPGERREAIAKLVNDSSDEEAKKIYLKMMLLPAKAVKPGLRKGVLSQRPTLFSIISDNEMEPPAT